MNDEVRRIIEQVDQLAEDRVVRNAEIKRLRQALGAVHEFHCGCEHPGNPSICVAKPTSAFVALAVKGVLDVY